MTTARPLTLQQALLLLVALCCIAPLCTAAHAAMPLQDEEVTPQVQQLYAEARAAQQSGAANEAIRKYRQIVQLAPHLAAAYNNLGMLYFNTQNFPDAAKTLERGLALNAQMPSAEAMLGMSYLAMGEAQKAQPPLELALRANPNDDLVQMSLARDQLQLGELEKAADLLRAYTTRNPKDEQAWYLLGKTYLQLSETALGKVNQIAPNSVVAYEVSGEIDESMHNYEGALLEYKKAVGLAPQQPGTHMHLANAYWLLAKWQDAAAEFRAELANAPHSCEAHWKLGDSLLQLNGDVPNALQQVNDAVEECPGLMQARVDRARALIKLSRALEALPDLQLALKADPSEPSIHFLLAAVYRAAGQKTAAEAEMATYAKLQQDAQQSTAKQASETLQVLSNAH